MKVCNWPEGCTRPVRANSKCASHDVMWRRKHPRRGGAPKKRGVKARRMLKAQWSLVVRGEHARKVVALLASGPMPLKALVTESGAAKTTVLTALRALEASGLEIQRTTKPDNAREVLRSVTTEEAQRYFRGLVGLAP